jgi:hypothetical protein
MGQGLIDTKHELHADCKLKAWELAKFFEAQESERERERERERNLLTINK